MSHLSKNNFYIARVFSSSSFVLNLYTILFNKADGPVFVIYLLCKTPIKKINITSRMQEPIDKNSDITASKKFERSIWKVCGIVALFISSGNILHFNLKSPIKNVLSFPTFAPQKNFSC
jgi:hypothetical protein